MSALPLKADIASWLDCSLRANRVTNAMEHSGGLRSPAQKVYILHKKLSLSGALCAKPARGETFHSRFKAINSRTREGQPSLPLSNREREWTPRRATLLCSPPCHSSAQASPGFGVTLFWVRSFFR